MATPQRRAVRRKVNARPSRPIDPDGYVATFDPEGVELRPLRARNPERTIYATWDQVYRWALIARTPPIQRPKRRRRKKK
jgi:hypothetical protein